MLGCREISNRESDKKADREGEEECTPVWAVEIRDRVLLLPHERSSTGAGWSSWGTGAPAEVGMPTPAAAVRSSLFRHVGLQQPAAQMRPAVAHALLAWIRMGRQIGESVIEASKESSRPAARRVDCLTDALL